MDETERSHFTHARTLTPHIHTLSEWHKWGSRNSAVIPEHFVIKNYLYYIHTLLSHHLKTPVIKQHLFYSRQRMWWLPCLLAIPYGAMLLARASYLTLLLNLQAGRRICDLWALKSSFLWNSLLFLPPCALIMFSCRFACARQHLKCSYFPVWFVQLNEDAISSRFTITE